MADRAGEIQPSLSEECYTSTEEMRSNHELFQIPHTQSQHKVFLEIIFTVLATLYQLDPFNSYAGKWRDVQEFA